MYFPLFLPFSAYFSRVLYVKNSTQRQCLNGDRECRQRYLLSTINTYVRQALTHCSSWDTTYKELQRLTQPLVNNDYKNSDVNETIRKTINTKQHPPPKNHMSSEYKKEENIIIYEVIPNLLMAPIGSLRKHTQQLTTSLFS